MSGIRLFEKIIMREIMLLVSIFFISGGCTPTMEIASCPVQPVNQYKCLVKDSGIAVALRPFYKPDETMKYFGMDFRKARIIAIQVIAENQSDSKSFLISKGQFSLGIPTDKADTGANEDSGAIWGATIGSALVAPPLAVVLLPFAMVSHDAASDSSMIKHNFLVNELQRHTLSPGDRVDGFVYIGMPEEMQNYPKSLVVTASITTLPSGKILPFTFKLEMDDDK